jgi:eukaryotic-like serine/threonine-protein kinase
MDKFAIDAAACAELNQLLDAALDQPVTQRAQWIETLGAEFEQLKPRLRGLLLRNAGAETDDFLSTLPTFDIEPTAAPADARVDQPGDEIGPYRLVSELGVGGMGTVWLAQRTDGLINRPIALKLPHGAWKRARLAERMARERGILATLNHPNIARLYDAGLTVDGQPYLAIEYVEGRPIDEHCRDRQLDLKSRLKLFVQVANAVAYAHGNLVVHRDLKPANILVTADGQVRLLDFGIAKLLQEGQAKGTQLTELSGRALTPDYASPEQILGAPLTIASDVYSLGVILYELLSGTRPYKLKRDSRGALEDAIVQREPAPPSTAVDRPRSKALSGDLDTIVLKALKKKPEERYLTVHALLDDIERYLNKRPVLARPDSAHYRLRKFIARHKLPVAAAAIVIAVVVAGAGVSLWQARVAIAERERAVQVKEFIASIMRGVDPYERSSSKPVDAIDLLRTARARADRELAEQHEVRIELLGIIGESFYGLRQNEQAAEVLSQALREAQGIPEMDPGTILHLRRVLSQAYDFLGKSADARRELQLVLDAYSRERRPPDEELIEARLHEATLDYNEAKYPEALDAATKALHLAETVPNAPRDAELEAVNRMASVHKSQELPDLAVREYERAHRLALDAYANDARHPRVLTVQMGYANALALDGRRLEALAHSQAAATAAIEVFGADNVMAGYFLNSLASIQIDVGEIRAALENSRSSLAIYQKTRQPGTRDHASRLRGLGRELLAARRPREAAQPLAESLEIAVRIKDRRGEQSSAAHYGLALSYLGRFDEADALLARAIGSDDGSWSRSRLDALSYMGVLRRLQGNSQAALVSLEKALALASERPRSELDRGQIFAQVGRARLELGQLDAAVESLESALALLEAVQIRTTPDQADVLVALGRAHLSLGQPPAALGPLQRADAFWREFDPENRSAAEAALWLSRCNLALDRSAKERRG